MLKKIKSFLAKPVIRCYIDAALTVSANVGCTEICPDGNLEVWKVLEEAVVWLGYQPSITVSHVINPPPDIIIGARSSEKYKIPWPQKLQPGEQPVYQAKIYERFCKGQNLYACRQVFP